MMNTTMIDGNGGGALNDLGSMIMMSFVSENEDMKNVTKIMNWQ